MANRTVKDASSIKGTNPQYLIEKIIRTRIYESKYWKEECFALSAELLVDKAMALRYIGGVFGGNVKPTPFLCLVLKMLQIQPETDIVIEFIKNVDFKYVRCLGAIYMRIVGSSLDCYKYLEPLYLDYRKLRRQNRSGEFESIHMDELIDELLREERVCDVMMPRIQKRHVLEESNQLEPRISGLDDEMDMESEEEEEMEDIRAGSVGPPSPDRTTGYRDHDRPRRSPSPRYRRSRSPARRPTHRASSHERDRDHKISRKRSRSRERHRDRERGERRRSRSKERHRPSAHKHKHKHDEEERSHKHHKSKKSKRDRDHGRDRDRGGGSRDNLSISESNALRAKLGLAPLRP